MKTWNPKVLPAHEFPTEDDYKKAAEFIVPSDWPENKIYTDEMRKGIQKTAREMMMKRKTLQ